MSGSVIPTGHSPPLGPEGAGGGSLAQALAQSGEGRGGPGSQRRSHTGKWKERPWDAGSASIPPSIDWVQETRRTSDRHRALWGTPSDPALPADPGGVEPREERGHPVDDSQRWEHMVSGEGPCPSLLQGCRGAPSPLLETPRWPASSVEVNSRTGPPRGTGACAGGRLTGAPKLLGHTCSPPCLRLLESVGLGWLYWGTGAGA